MPLAIGIMGSTIGILPTHCACLAHAGDGILIAGASGAGKSTLSAELCKADTSFALQYIADDWTYITLQQERLVAHGIGARIKLLPDAVDHFPALGVKKTHISMNGEVAYEVHPGQVFGAHVIHQCRPRWLIFLERGAKAGVTFTPLDRDYTRNYLHQNVERLPVQMPDASLRRGRLMNAVAELPSWHMCYGGSPAFAARKLKEFIGTLRQECA